MKNYLSFVPKGTLPTGPNVFLECLQCGEIIPLSLEKNTRCKCQNIRLDAQAGRIAIRDWSAIKLFQEVPDPSSGVA
jgi:hypothetical protein